MSRRARRVPLHLERLEDRLTPSTGGLDSAFNVGNGYAQAAFDLGGSNNDTGTDVAVQTDGKYVVVGSSQFSATDFDFAIARFNRDGTLDTTFNGSGGKKAVSFDIGGSLER